MGYQKKRCVCGRVVAAYPPPASSKARVRHNCPHGKPCIAGLMGKNAHGFNHNTRCRECLRAEGVERLRGPSTCAKLLLD